MGLPTTTTFLTIVALLFMFAIMVMGAVSTTSVNDLSCYGDNGTDKDKQKSQNIYNSSIGITISAAIVVVILGVVLYMSFQSKIHDFAGRAYQSGKEFAGEYGPKASQAMQEAMQRAYKAGQQAGQQMGQWGQQAYSAMSSNE